MGALFSMLFSPVGMLWTLMESRIWVSMAVLTAAGFGANYMGRNLIACFIACVVATLMMRVDAVKAAAVPAE
jgi:hypothetical protein